MHAVPMSDALEADVPTDFPCPSRKPKNHGTVIIAKPFVLSCKTSAIKPILLRQGLKTMRKWSDLSYLKGINKASTKARLKVQQDIDIMD
jgi:hypothetical protein